MARPSKITEEGMVLIKELCEKGLTTTEISEELFNELAISVSRVRITQIIKDNDDMVSKRAGRPSASRIKIDFDKIDPTKSEKLKKQIGELMAQRVGYLECKRIQQYEDEEWDKYNPHDKLKKGQHYRDALDYDTLIDDITKKIDAKHYATKDEMEILMTSPKETEKKVSHPFRVQENFLHRDTTPNPDLTIDYIFDRQRQYEEMFLTDYDVNFDEGTYRIIFYAEQRDDNGRILPFVIFARVNDDKEICYVQGGWTGEYMKTALRRIVGPEYTPTRISEPVYIDIRLQVIEEHKHEVIYTFKSITKHRPKKKERTVIIS